MPRVIDMPATDVPVVSTYKWKAIALLEAYTKTTDFVVSDDQMLVFRAGRQTPPELCDTSFVRLETGYLTDEDAIQASRDAEAIIFSTGRLGALKRYVQWVEREFEVLERVDLVNARLFIRRRDGGRSR
jgi:hypothetical protein